jgi:acetylornithine deacetylase
MKTDLEDVVSQATLVEWTQRFVRFASPQTERFEEEPAVQAFIGDVDALLHDLEIPFCRDPMGSLIVELGPTSGRSAVLMAYAMTHPATSMRNPYGGEIVSIDGVPAIRGRGVSEQKAPLAAALAATYAAYRSGGLTGRLVFTVSSAGETGRHDAARSILASLATRPTAAVIVIGTTGQVSLANKGRIDVQIIVHGRAAHSSTPWRGLDAVAGAREVMRRLEALDLGGRLHSGLGNATLALTSIKSFPDATHTIQSEVRITYDRRLLPGDQPEAALAQIQTELKDVARWRVEVNLGPVMFPSEIRSDGELIKSISRGHLKAGLPVPANFYSHGSLDAGLFCNEGIEATMWGPGAMDQWHSDDEYVLTSDLWNGARAYYAFIRDYLMET